MLSQAGSTVASQIRRVLPNATITLIGRESQIGYGTCGLPYVIGGLIEDETKVSGPAPQRFGDKRNITMLIRHEVMAINRDEKTIMVQNLDKDENFTLPYDKLILATGGKSRVPVINGIGNLPLHTLKSYEDMKEILKFIDQEKPKSCAIIGSGFIGIELAENFSRLGIKTTMIDRGDRIMKAMDRQISEVLYQEMLNHEVEFYFNDGIEQVEGSTLMLKKGTKLDVDFIVASIGMIPNTALAESIGLKIGATKGIVVNEYMQTNDPDIYAIGDVAETSDWHTGKPKRVQLAWHAHRQAYIVASHLSDHPVKINGFLGTTITKLFSLTAGMTGHSESSLTKEAIDFETVTHKGRTNAGYYPDHGMIELRVHYDRETRLILGGQAVGDKGVDKRIDVIATAMMGKMTVDDLAALELSYSPPYSSPKDPVNMLGYKANT